MITTGDFRCNLKFIALGSKLCILPLQVDVENGRLGLLDSKWKKGGSWAYLAMFVIYMTYLALRLPYLILTGKPIPLPSLIWHLTVFLGLPNMGFWYYKIYFRCPGITVTRGANRYDTDSNSDYNSTF